MSKIVFVGQQPAQQKDEGLVLPVRSGSSGDRIVRMMGITEEAFRKNFDCINVSARYDPDGFSPKDYFAEIMNIRDLLVGRRIVLLGPAVAEAFQIERHQYNWCDWFDHPSWDEYHASFSVIPHPSGSNRLYNNPEMFDMIRGHLNQIWEDSIGET